jgi:CCR4-NOT transcription complex subunit 9
MSLPPLSGTVGGGGSGTAVGGGAASGGAVPGAVPPPFPSRLYAHVLELSVSEKREAALLELSKKREDFADLAPILWHSFGTIAALLQEIVAIYPLLAPPRLTPGKRSTY